jgi:hypothetical protein
LNEHVDRVELTRSGGVAGITVRASCEAAELSPDEADMLQHLMVRAASEPAQPASSGGADRYQYDLTVTDSEGQRTLSFREHELAPEERRVLNRLVTTRRSPRKEP